MRHASLNGAAILPKVLASAPGKVTLFGEHAIVYGYPAIVTSIGKRVYVTAEPRNDEAVRIAALDLRVPGVIVTYKGEEVIIGTDYGQTLSAVAYLNKAVELTAKHIGVKRGVNLTVRSEMPVGAGLGTSAAVSVATVAAYAACMGYELTREEIADLGWAVEKAVQGLASPMDTSIATFGGVLKIKAVSPGRFIREKLDVRANLPVVIGYVERQATTKEMVAKVKELKERYPEVVDGIMRIIGDVTEKAEKALLAGDLQVVGELMNVNHGLLDALGVSNMRLNEIVYVARAAGALGSKLTGAGGGGAVIALAPGLQERVEVAMRLHSTLTLRTDVGAEGVSVEILEK